MNNPYFKLVIYHYIKPSVRDSNLLQLAFTFVADIICIDYVRTVIGQTQKGNEENEESDETRPRVEPYYITCMTITILGAVLAVVSLILI